MYHKLNMRKSRQTQNSDCPSRESIYFLLCHLNQWDPLTTAEFILGGERGGGINSVSSCELKLHLHAEQLHPLQMSRGLARPRASTSITVSSTGQTLVDNCQKESRDAGGSVPCSHSCCTKSAERGHKMACALCLNISHLQSNLMNYSDVAIYCASHLKHLPCQPVC